MTKRTCDCCGDDMEDDYEPKFLITYGNRKVRVIVSMLGDDEDPGEDICKQCSRQALENIGFIEDDDG